MLRGRGLSLRDTHGAPPAAVINDAFAQKYFAGRTPLGERVLIPEVSFGKMGLGADVPWEIVGIVADERVSGLENDEREPIVYVNHEQATQMISQFLVVRSELASAALERQVRETIHRLDPDQVIMDVQTMDQLKASFLGPRRFQSLLLGAFATMALVLAALGIYGVLDYSVEQRTRELGIRSALGATARQLIGHIFASGMKLVALGLAVGVALAFALSQLLTSLVYGVSARDPLSLVAGALGLFAAAALASYLPARRAAKVDPIVCLRAE